MPQLDLYIWSLTVTVVLILFGFFYLLISYFFLFDLACVIYLKYFYIVYDKEVYINYLEFFDKTLSNFFGDERLVLLTIWNAVLLQFMDIVAIFINFLNRFSSIYLIKDSSKFLLDLLCVINTDLIRLHLLKIVY